MKRFIIRNYGASRQFPYKGQPIPISNDSAIETDDEKLAIFFKEQQAIHVTDRGSELAPPSSVEEPEKPEESDEIAYNDMLLKELQVIAKDREIKTSGLSKAKLIEARKAYDAAPVEEEVIA